MRRPETDPGLVPGDMVNLRQYNSSDQTHSTWLPLELLEQKLKLVAKELYIYQVRQATLAPFPRDQMLLIGTTKDSVTTFYTLLTRDHGIIELNTDDLEISRWCVLVLEKVE